MKNLKNLLKTRKKIQKEKKMKMEMMKIIKKKIWK